MQPFDSFSHRKLAIGMMAALLLAGCGKKRTPQYVHIGPDSLPTQSYEREPEERFNRSDYVIKLKQMTSFYDVPGEAGYFMNGEDYGFDGLSFILTETQAGGGPPLHTHESEESHVVLHGRVEYLIGSRRFTVEGPYVARVPAGMPHQSRSQSSTVSSTVDGPEEATHDVPSRLNPDATASANTDT